MRNQVTIAGKVYEGANGGEGTVAKLRPVLLEVVEIDQLLAAEIKQEATVQMPGQRTQDSKTVQEYMRLMTKGLWNLSTIIIVEVIHPDGAPETRNGSKDVPDQPLAYLVNGNHTLQAVIDSGVTVQALVGVFRATREDMHLLFSQIDNHRPRRATTAMEPLARTFGIRPARGKNSEGKNVVTAKILETIVTAIQWASIDGFCARPTAPKRDVAFAHGQTSRPFVNWLISINNDPGKPFGKDFDGISESWLWRLPVIAAMWKTFQQSETDATNFWSQITKPLPNDPNAAEPSIPNKLRNLLLGNPNGKTWGSNPNLRILKACSMAWYAHYNKGSFSGDIAEICRIPDDSLSVIIFDIAAVDAKLTKPRNSEVKHGSIDRRTTVADAREGNEEKHHITVEASK